jgi:hypothetical protein
MSDHDIAAGSRWFNEVFTELADARLGILCITPENVNSTWLLFEAGALSKTLEQTSVCPLLFDLSSVELIGPLSQFQSHVLGKDGVWRILETLNEALGTEKLPLEALRETYEVWWPKLKAKIDEIPTVKNPPEPKRTPESLLEEILSHVRELSRRAESERALFLKFEEKGGPIQEALRQARLIDNLTRHGGVRIPNPLLESLVRAILEKHETSQAPDAGKTKDE